jgi:hypothetical protein
MDYATLTTNIEDICENTFTADQLAMFAQQAEQKIYNAVDFPALRKNSEGTMTADSQYLSVPDDYLYVHSLAVIDGAGDYHYLLPKDVNFVRDAYPNPTDTGLPKHYGHFNESCLILGPTPDAGYGIELHYGYYPESVVTAGTTWLGDNFDSALLNGSLVEAIRFMKGEADLVAMYDKFYQEAVMLLKSLGEGKLRRDSYRDGQPAMAVL